MGDIFYYLELRAQGRTRESRFHKSWKAVKYMLEDAAAIPNSNEPCQFDEVSRATFLMDFSPNRLRIASTHGDHSVRVSNALTGVCTHILRGHPRTPWCLAFSPTSDDILASGCLNGEIRIWDLMGGGSEVLQNPRGVQVITSLAFHPGGEVLVFATTNYIYFWDWSSGKPFAFTKTSLESERVRWLKYDPYGHYLYTGIENHAGFSRDPVTGQVIISNGEVDDAGDASNMEERRNRLLQNHSRDQPAADRLMGDRVERLFAAEESDSAVGNIRENVTGDTRDSAAGGVCGRVTGNIHDSAAVNNRGGASGSVRPHQNSYDPLSNPYRARQGIHSVADGISVRNPGQSIGQSYLNPPMFPVPFAAGEASVERDNRPGRRGFDSTSSSHARRGEVQPRQRWGRYEPSFFTRADSSHVSGANSGASSSSHFASSSYRSGFQENVAARMNMEMSSFRQRSHLRSSLRTNLFPAVPNRSADASEAASSFNVLPREASGSQNADSDVDTDEFQIVPVDQGQNRGENTRNVRVPSTSLVHECSSVNSSLRQKQDEYHALLLRYVSRYNGGPAATSGSDTCANHGSFLTSSSLLPSAASIEDNDSANTRLPVPLLTKQAKSSSLPPEETRATRVGPANSVSNLAPSALCGTDNEGSLEIPAVNAASACTSTSEHTANSCESDDTSDSAVSNRYDSLFSNLELVLPRACGKSSNIDHSSQTVSIKTAGDLKENNSSEGSVVSTDTSLQIDSGSRCAENIPVSLQNSLSECTDIALCIQDPVAGCSSSTAGQQNTLAGKSVCSEQNSASEQNGCGKYENKDGSTPVPELKESTENESLSNSQTRSGVVDKSKDDSLQKYKSVHSKVNTVKLSTARIRLYEAESKRANRSKQNLHSGSQELSLNGESSTNNNLPQNDVRARSTHTNSQSSNIGLSRPENIHRADVAPASGSEDRDIDNPLLRSSVPWHTRVDSWMMRFPVSENSESYRTHIREYLNSLVRPDVTSWLERSYAVRSALFPPLRQHQNQTWRSPAMTYGRLALDPLDFRNRLSVFQDRQIPRPVADQTSQTLGAMSLPASSDQGTDVVGLNEAPLDLSQTDTSSGHSRFGNVRLSFTINSIPGCARMIAVERTEPAEQHCLNSGSSSNSTRRPILGSSASRALRLFTDGDLAALESNHLHTSTDIPGGSRSLASSIGFRPVTNGINNEQPRFHPYSLHHGSDSLHPRALHSSRDSMNRFSAASHTGTSSTSVTSSVPTGSSTPSLHHGSLASQTAVSVEGASRLRQLSESSQRSAFSVFSISSRETPSNQPRLRTFSSRLNSDSLPHRSRHGTQLSTPSQNSSESLVSEQNTSQDSATNAERHEDLPDSLSNRNETPRTSVRNLNWQTPGISLGNQVEYLERRVMELDRRLTSLEHSYSSRLLEMHQAQQRRRSFMNAINASVSSTSSTTSVTPRVLPNVLSWPAFLRTNAAALEGLTRPNTDHSQNRNSGLERSERAIPPQGRDESSDDSDERAVLAMDMQSPFNNRQPSYYYPDGSEWMRLTDGPPGHLDRGSNAHPADNQLEGNAIFGGQSHRIQQWDVSKYPVPDISDAKANIIVQHCKLHNDASCNLSQDGSLLAVIRPGNRAFMDDVFVAVYSLKRQSHGQCLYTRKFGSHAISLSISPLNRYLLVGLASKRTMLMSNSLMVGQVFKLVEKDDEGKTMKHYKDIYHVYEDTRFNYVTVNSARWLPGVGEGLVYGTNRGEMNFFRVESRKVYDKVSLDDKEEESRQRNTTRNSIATQTTTVSIRRSASTQTANESEERVDIEEATATQVID